MTVKIEIKDNAVTIDGHYEIGLERIPNHAALVEWIAHLCQKTWFTTRAVEELIHRVSDAKGWSVYGNHD